MNNLLDDGEVLGAMLTVLLICLAMFTPNLCHGIKHLWRKMKETNV